MALSINTNVASLNAQRNLSASQSTLSRSMQRLSSGLRINSAKDDAAGLAISDRMTSQIRGMNQAARNASDGISMAQTAEGALQEVTNMMQRMRELSVQGANSATYGGDDLKSISDEIKQFGTEIDRILNVTQFNGKKILGADAADMVFQVGANTTADVDTITVPLTDMTGELADVSSDIATLTDAAAADTDGTKFQAIITAIDDALKTVDTKRGDLGAVQSRFESTIANLQNVAENLSAARGRIMDADVAQETSEMTKQNILQQAGVSILAQANQTPQLALSLLK
ncbi:MAG: flagellin FliC [Desulfobulbus sp.]|jgi:flagellin|uniref:flagellin N-terminal helical domain-containing protein n=1 Tax=Desulfobulbus sp. TaxID=895 RepID=UPI00284F0A62|nr:flagellin [Desulfobulbus sp.]MDR2550736.1 flagellin FliC [Desulfobulbus sp.]